MVSPTGERIVPVDLREAQADSAVVSLADPSNNCTYVALNSPPRGPGSSSPRRALRRSSRSTGVGACGPRGHGKGQRGRALAHPLLQGQVRAARRGYVHRARRSGRARDRIREEDPRAHSSSLRGTGARATSSPYVTRDGIPRMSPVVATFNAPPPIRPAKVRGLKVSHPKSTLLARWRKAPGAGSYLVRVHLTDGRTLVKLLGRRKTSLKIPGVKASLHAKVAVTPRSAHGRSGPPARASA